MTKLETSLEIQKMAGIKISNFDLSDKEMSSLEDFLKRRALYQNVHGEMDYILLVQPNEISHSLLQNGLPEKMAPLYKEAQKQGVSFVCFWM